MRLPLAAAFSFALVACGGDDGPSTPDVDAPPASLCTPPASPALPATGEFNAPDDLPLTGCVAGGLRDLPGRWWIADLTQLFSFSYPKFAGSCDTGFRDPLAPPDDPDEADGRSRHTWTDGTVFFTRRYSSFEIGKGEVLEFVRARAMCLTADGTLAVAFGNFDSDNGSSTSTAQGSRFAPKDEPARGLTMLGSIASWGLEGQAIVGYNVVVDGTHAYVVGVNGLDIIDVSVPATPTHVGHIGGGDLDGFNDVRVVRGNNRVIAFASALGTDVTYVIDVTNPAQPAFLADIPEFSHSVQVRVDGDRTLLYLATYTNAVPVYDVTDPTTPVRLGAPTVVDEDQSAGIHDLTVDGNMIYANNTTDGVVAIDVSAGFDQPSVERFRLDTTYSHAGWVATIGGKKIFIHGDEGMTPEGGAFMRIIDAEPGSPTFGQELSRYRTRREVGIHNMEIRGTKAYVAYYQDGVRIIELADPTNPVEVAHFNTFDDANASGAAFEGAVGARPYGDLVYVADYNLGLIILRETP